MNLSTRISNLALGMISFCVALIVGSIVLVKGALAEGDFEMTSEQSTTLENEENCPSLDELICICISEMISKDTYPPNSDADKQFKEDAEAITDAVACRKKEWGRIGQVACTKDLCDEAKGGKAGKGWPGNSKRNFESCKEAALKTIQKCAPTNQDADEGAGGSSTGGTGGSSGGGLDCRYKHWYHQDDPGYQPPDGDNDPYNNDPAWCSEDMLNDPTTKKSKYKNYGKPDPVHLIIPRDVKGKDKPGPYDTGSNGTAGPCKDYKFP